MSAVATARQLVASAASHIRLLDTPGLPATLPAPPAPEDEAARARADAEFHAACPGSQPCSACGCRRWEIGRDREGSRAWLCAGCHRAPMTREAWLAEIGGGAARATPAKPTPSAQERRAALATAIADRAAATQRIETLRQSLSTLRGEVETAEAARDAVAGALEAARASAVTAVADEGRPPPSLTIPRAKLAEAEDALATTVAARRRVSDQLEAAQAALASADRRVRSAALAVLRTELSGQLVERADHLRREFVAEATAIRELHRAGAMIADARVQAALSVLERLAPNPAETADAVGRVRAMLDALQQQADARL